MKLSLLVFVVTLISTIATVGQELKHSDLSSMTKRSTGYKSYIAQDGSIYKIGDSLEIGVPSQGNFFLHLTKGTGFFGKPLTTNVARLKIEIKEISVAKAIAGNCIVAMTVTTPDANEYALFSLDEAIVKGEIIPHGKADASNVAGLERVNSESNKSVKNDAPERVNKTLPQISDKVLWSLTEATGWMQNSEGQWLEGKNKIQLSIASVGSKDKWNQEYFIPGRDNFTRFELREIILNGNRLFLLTKEMIEGRWKHDPIESDWLNEKKVKYAVFKRNAAVVAEKKVGQHSYPYYKSSIFYIGEVPYSETYLNEIGLQLSRPEYFGAKPSTLTEQSETYSKLAVIYKILPDGINCRFYIENINEDPQFIGPMRYQFHPRFKFNNYTSAPEKLYFECPKKSIEGLISFMTKK